MNTFGELIQAVKDDLSIPLSTSIFSDDLIKRAINRAYIKAGNLYRWSTLEDALTTSTIAGQDYYDFPSNWQPDSAWKLKVDGVDYGDPLVFKDFLYEVENGVPSGADYLWSTQWKRFFIYPTPTKNGINNIEIWGFKTVGKLVNDNDKTIFSDNLKECNEAIVLEAEAILTKKEEKEQIGQFRSLEAKQILSIAYSKQLTNQNKYLRTVSFWSVPDFFK